MAMRDFTISFKWLFRFTFLFWPQKFKRVVFEKKTYIVFFLYQQNWNICLRSTFFLHQHANLRGIGWKKIIEISQTLVTSWLTIYFLMTFGSSRPFMGAKKAPLNSSWKTESGRRLFEHPQITSKFDLTWPDLHLIECVFTLTPNVIEVAPKLLVVCPHYILWAK